MIVEGHDAVAFGIGHVIAEDGGILPVQRFIAVDPLRTQRLALGLALARHRAGAAGVRLSVFIGHALGGGAETYLSQRIGRELDMTGHAVVLRAMQDGTWKVELHGLRGRSVGLATDTKARSPCWAMPAA